MGQKQASPEHPQGVRRSPLGPECPKPQRPQGPRHWTHRPRLRGGRGVAAGALPLGARAPRQELLHGTGWVLSEGRCALVWAPQLRRLPGHLHAVRTAALVPHSMCLKMWQTSWPRLPAPRPERGVACAPSPGATAIVYIAVFRGIFICLLLRCPHGVTEWEGKELRSRSPAGPLPARRCPHSGSRSQRLRLRSRTAAQGGARAAAGAALMLLLQVRGQSQATAVTSVHPDSAVKLPLGALN